MSERKKISMKTCRCSSSSETMARLKLARLLPHRDVYIYIYRSCLLFSINFAVPLAMQPWVFGQSTMMSLVIVWESRCSLIDSGPTSRGSRTARLASRTAKNLACKKNLWIALIYVWCFANFCVILWSYMEVVCDRFQVPGWPSLPYLQSLEEDERNKCLDSYASEITEVFLKLVQPSTHISYMYIYFYSIYI